MPVKRRVDKRREELTPEAEAWLTGEEPRGEFWIFESKDKLARTWADHRDRILAEWVAKNPGTRPAQWWDYDAPRIPLGTYTGRFYDGELPEPRQRLAGTGTPAHETQAYIPQSRFGVLYSWLGADPADPLIIESEAAYLQRHNLFFPGEKRRLKAADFQGEKR
jgi:hypothetical protein